MPSPFTQILFGGEIHELTSLEVEWLHQQLAVVPDQHNRVGPRFLQDFGDGEARTGAPEIDLGFDVLFNFDSSTVTLLAEVDADYQPASYHKVGHLAYKFLTRWRPGEYFQMTYSAFSHSRYEASGGAIFVTAYGTAWHNGEHWMGQKRHELEKMRRRPWIHRPVAGAIGMNSSLLRTQF